MDGVWAEGDDATDGTRADDGRRGHLVLARAIVYWTCVGEHVGDNDLDDGTAWCWLGSWHGLDFSVDAGLDGRED